MSVEARLYIYSDKNSGWNTAFTMGQGQPSQNALFVLMNISVCGVFF